MIANHTVRTIRNEFRLRFLDNDFVTDKSGVRTVEMLGASFIADQPSIFGKVDYNYIDREIDWYMSESLYVKDFPGGAPQIWKDVADKNGRINSNYGWALFSLQNFTQLEQVLHALVKNPNTRQAIAIYTRPTMHIDSCRDGMSDFMCTNTVQYLIRNKKLHVIVNMRSNDVVFGYRNDHAWQRYIAEKLIVDINANGVEVDSYEITWQVGSLHVYERHFWMIEAFHQFQDPMMTKKDYEEQMEKYYR